MFRRHLALSMFLPLFALQIHSTEVDSFTDRDPFMKDATAELNDLMDGYFAQAVEQANGKRSCDSKVIEKSLLDQIGGSLWAQIEIDIENSPTIDKRTTLVENSVYADASFIDAFALYLAKLGFLMRFGDYYIGSDKFGHFIHLGHDYYDLVYNKGKPLSKALAWGEMTETTYYGLATTGIYSYGDLSANFDGVSFWQRVTNTKLPQNVEPYFTCQNNTWKVTGPFDWNDYIKAAWDEGLNCSGYITPEMEEGINKRIRSLEKKRFTKLTCPVEPKFCSEMVNFYGVLAPRIITPKCFEN
jgi:hypothetical protein